MIKKVRSSTNNCEGCMFYLENTVCILDELENYIDSDLPITCCDDKYTYIFKYTSKV